MMGYRTYELSDSICSHVLVTEHGDGKLMNGPHRGWVVIFPHSLPTCERL